MSNAEALDPGPAPGGDAPPRRGRFVLAATWAYAALILIVLILIHWVGEIWWGVTVVLFLPRWLFLVPVPLLALAGAWSRRPSLLVTQAAIALVVAGPLMGVSLPVHRLWTSRVPGTRVRFLSYNLGDSLVDARALIAMIERERIDVIAFQEGVNERPALEPFFAKGWYRDRTGFLASRYPIVSEMEPLAELDTPPDEHCARLSRVRVQLPGGRDVLLASVHMPTMRKGLESLFARDIPTFRVHIDWWRRELDRVVRGLSESRTLPFLVGGDFNMPSDDSSMATLRTALRFGFEDAGWGYGYTRPTALPWFRIDHIMSSPEWVFTRCWVGTDCGSDHLPLIAEAVLTRTGDR